MISTTYIKLIQLHNCLFFYMPPFPVCCNSEFTGITDCPKSKLFLIPRYYSILHIFCTGILGVYNTVVFTWLSPRKDFHHVEGIILFGAGIISFAFSFAVYLLLKNLPEYHCIQSDPEPRTSSDQLYVSNQTRSDAFFPEKFWPWIVVSFYYRYFTKSFCPSFSKYLHIAYKHMFSTIC